MITGLFDLGTEFYTGEKSIAALQYPVLKSPKIWFSTKLNKDRKFLLAAAIETLLIACSDNTNNDQMIKD